MRKFLWRWWPFALLCSACFSRFVLADNFPVVLSTAASLTAASGLLALSCAVFAAAKQVPLPHRLAGYPVAMIGGALFFCGPACAFLFHAADTVESDVFLASSLIPVVVAVASAARGEAPLSAKTLWPGIAAAAALLLLFPEPRVHSLAGILTLVLLPIMTGVGASLMVANGSDNQRWQAVLALLGACVVFALFLVIPRAATKAFSWQACGFDLFALSSALLSLVRLGARRYSAYFVLTPFFVTLYGLLLFRPALGLRMSAGLLVLLASGIALLNARDSADDGSFRLLP